jgi:hypothetical protein
MVDKSKSEGVAATMQLINRAWLAGRVSSRLVVPDKYL